MKQALSPAFAPGRLPHLPSLAFFVILCGLAAAAPTAAAELESEADKASYALGVAIGRRLHEQFGDMEIDVFLEGVRDSMNQAPPRLPPEEMQQVIQEYTKRQESKARQAGESNLDVGREFLRENAGREGVQSLKSGLQYKVEKTGDGPSPTPDSTVVVHYHGTLIDGKVFDSSRKRGTPLTIPLNSVVQGWREALPLMTVGSRWVLYLPPDLAYGERGSPPTIGPNATLIFDVELLDISP